MRARADLTQEVMVELGHVFDEVGSEAFCWEGNEEQKEGKSSVAKAHLHRGGGRVHWGKGQRGILSGDCPH